MADRREFIRDSMRRMFGAGTRAYAEIAAPSHAEHTAMLISKMHLRAGERVVDVATGPGVVALAAAAAVGPSGQVVATDLVPEWEEIIAEGCQKAGITNVTFRAMGAEALDLPDKFFDVALCQFGLMPVPNPVQALREMRRVLRDGGRLGISVWGTLEKVAVFGVAGRVMAPYIPQLPPEERLPAPTALGEPGLIERLVEEASYHDISVELHTFDAVFNDAEEYLRGRGCAPTEVSGALERLTPEQREQLDRELIAELERYRRGGKIRLPSEAIYVTAVR
jgi:SAM-dependent methyltransferase